MSKIIGIVLVLVFLVGIFIMVASIPKGNDSDIEDLCNCDYELNRCLEGEGDYEIVPCPQGDNPRTQPEICFRLDKNE